MNLEKDSDFTRAWEYHKHADDLLAARMSYGMVAQSMLLTAFAMLFVADPTRLGWHLVAVELLIALFGIAYSLIQMRMADEMLHWMTHLKEKYLRTDALYHSGYLKAYLRTKRSLQRRVPKMLAGVWFVLAVIAIHANWPISN